jgi:hypothetical protein
MLEPIRDDAVFHYTADLHKHLRKFFERQRNAQRPGKDWDGERWDAELAEDMYLMSIPVVDQAGRKAAKAFAGQFIVEKADEYVTETSRVGAERVNKHTKRMLEEPEADHEKVFEDLVNMRSLVIAATMATSMTNFATHEAAHQSGRTKKTWVVTSPRSRHPELNGETVDVDAPFSNGARWPGDMTLPADESARCQCLLAFE